jgi:hypothetical protein
MATLNDTYYSLADMAKLKAPDGSELNIAEILMQATPLMEDMNFVEGNLTTGFKSPLRTELPGSTFVKYYEGILPSKGKKQTVTFGTSRQRALAEIDSDLLDLDNNKAIALMDASVEHIMGMGQDWEDEVLYGTGANPERIIGLAPTFDHLSASETDIGFNVIDGGGVGADNTSIWFIYWGKGNIHGIFPKGSTAGIHQKMWKPRMVTAPDGVGKYEAIQILYKFDGGLAIPDWRAAVRIANIDVSELDDAGESTYDGAPLINLLIRAYNKFKPQVKAMGKPYIYCNRTVMTALDLIANNKSTLALSSSRDVDGKPMIDFRGVPIKMAERIIDTEAAVS